MIKLIDKNKVRVHRHERIRNKISGTPERPRLCVFRSNKHISAQIIDDTKGVTLASASSVALKLANGSNVEAAKTVGLELGKAALAAGVTEVVFDRSGYVYHGRVAALADGAREAGLKF
jgi:large subunit ribosomal protein L18